MGIRRRVTKIEPDPKVKYRWNITMDCGCTTYIESTRKPKMKTCQCGYWEHMRKGFIPKEKV